MFASLSRRDLISSCKTDKGLRDVHRTPCRVHKQMLRALRPLWAARVLNRPSSVTLRTKRMVQCRFRVASYLSGAWIVLIVVFVYVSVVAFLLGAYMKPVPS